MELSHVNAIVTGAAGGLGRCFCQELIRAGARVVGGDIDRDELQSLGDAAHDRFHGLHLNVMQEKSIQEFVAAAIARMGTVNLLINNAGILRDGLLVKPEDGWIRKLPSAQWKAVLDTNLSGPFYMAREVAAHMVECKIKPALLVNISSVTRSGNPGQSNYSASKAGLDAETRTWALELAPFGIRVGGIAPGIVQTPILGNISPEQLKELAASTPIGRIGQPFEIWQALRFIIECEFFTGRIVEVDGGAHF